ncbi:ABC transporter substrate-binding protein [Streptomyces sp. SL13]|jgi:peptide/nickel transport system substrate-binding protein|uniref:ABC transporter substrate-binding protein n=1 Tax=Streptantibioticus silvisoli TaxID=2705255 RepID=A0AA90H471_9ACTN|nr:ABC transporter substrate-binding protein [Streptantibioticus silvisoli]MDI5963917.1 ABC transporter substrate-binding protein [Streptantibioticus silvisoli]MDI5970465.1 ABC transporter substrate-binding protein [Streptantibioticus silvisoli]
MMRRTRTAAITATAIALALGATACGGSSGGSGGKATKGGTLTILNKADYDHLDPQRTYTTEGSSMDTEIVRALTGWDESTSTPKLVGDLATNTGTPTKNDTVWTFHLRAGVKFQDGTTVTSQDVKYGVERAFSADINGGPPYASQWLIGGSKYKGPYTGKSLDSIQTPDASTIVFNLDQPVADFNETTAMPGWSAVPKAHDTGATYDTHVWSDGPYMMKSYTKNKELVLVRNPYWSQKTDPLRQQNVNEMDVKFGMDEAAIDNLLKSDSGSAQTSIQQWPIAGSDLAGINGDKALASRYYKIPAPGINYLTLNVNRIKDIRVRKAIEYAIDKTAVRGAFGGEAYGAYATTMLNPGMGGYKQYNEYSSNPAGDVTKAKALMSQAGNPKLTLSVAVENTPTQEHAGDAIANSLARIGIKVNVSPIDASTYFSTLDNTKNQYDMAWMDWIADWPNASTVLPVLFDGRQIKANPLSNQDISYLNDPAINSGFDKAAKMTDINTRNAAYGALDQQILSQASVVPLMYMSFTELSGSKVGGVINDPILAEPSLAHVFLKS